MKRKSTEARHVVKKTSGPTKKFIPEGARQNYSHRLSETGPPKHVLNMPKPRLNPFSIIEKRKQKPGVAALAHIHKLQMTTNTLIPKVCFRNLVREICEEELGTDKRWTSLGMEALQNAAEDYMVGLFEDSYLCTVHAKRVTLMSKDIQLARRIRGFGDPANK